MPTKPIKPKYKPGIELHQEITVEVDGRIMQTGFALVTPEIAQAWLEGRAPNRNQKDKTIARYTSDMQAGEWKVTHQGVGLNSKGQIVDGQHRLCAIINSGVSVWMPVTYGVDDVIAVDAHRARYACDVITMQTGQKVTIRVTAMANAMVEYTRADNWPQGMSHSLMSKFIATHQAAIVFTDHYFKVKPKLSSAPVMAAIARAYYHEDHERLLEFIHVLLSGHPNGPADYPAIKLRDYLMNEAGYGDRGARIAKYRRTEYALYHFCKRAEMKRLKAAAGEIYPLPTESDFQSHDQEEPEDIEAYEATIVEEAVPLIGVVGPAAEEDAEESSETELVSA